MPRVSAWFLSEERQRARRARAERRRQREGRPHELRCFVQLDDPYSVLLLQALPSFLKRHAVQCRFVLVPPPSDAAAPDRARLEVYSRRDAAELARRWGLWFEDPGHAPDPARLQALALRLMACTDADFLQLALPGLRELWQGGPGDPVPPEPALAAHWARGARERERLGHYLGAMLYYEGEWYWGIDRLHHLEKRLQSLGALREGEATSRWAPRRPSPQAARASSAPETEIDFFFSFRSPYSALVAPRVFELARRTGVRVNLRFVLPMVMRGLAVPAAKRRYISLDAAREARERGVPFGRLNDPVGRPTERGLALVPWAEAQGRGPDYVMAFMRLVWSEGVDAGSDRGLRRIVEAAGLDWDGARAALHDERWRQTAEANRQALLDLGLWGVPSFRMGPLSAWGQDRFDWIEQDLLEDRPHD